MSTVAVEPPARAWLAAALRDGDLPRQAGALDTGELIDAAADEGVVALLEWCLRSGRVRDDLPEGLRQALADGARTAAAEWLLRHHELRRIAEMFAQAGVRALLLKGSALALWLYPQPYLRMGGDIDLLFESHHEALRAVEVLSGLGYSLAFAPADTHYEMTSRLMVDGVLRSELDLHYRLLNAAAYADILGFEELWLTSTAVPGAGDAFRALSPLHALAHACLNRALDLQNGIPDRLKLLYDIRLLAARSGAPEWSALCALAEAKGIAGACLRSLEDARHWLGADVPAEVCARLRELAEADPLDHGRVDDWRYMQWRNFMALPDLSSRARWLWARMFPSSAQLRELYGDGPWRTLMLRRMRSGLSRLR